MEDQSEKDFDLIFDEIIRQFNVQSEIDNFHNSKISIIMGFISLVFVYLLSSDISEIGKIPYPKLFGLGLVLIILSGIIAIIVFMKGKFGTGIDINELIDIYKKKEYSNLKEYIAKGIYEANRYNYERIKEKSRIISIGFALLFTGMILILISRYGGLIDG